MESQSGAVNECRQKDKITLTCTLSTLINNKDNKKFSDWAALTLLAPGLVVVPRPDFRSDTLR